RQGQLAAAIDLLRRASAELERERHVVLAPGCGTALAEALAATGQFSEALTTLEEAIAQRDGSGASFDMPEMLRVKARILASQRQSTGEALACLAHAMDLARAQSALSWELRIALSQAQMQRGDETALRCLRLTRARFSEGAGTADLRLADQLLG